jgi:hypothetical protein
MCEQPVRLTRHPGAVFLTLGAKIGQREPVRPAME